MRVIFLDIDGVMATRRTRFQSFDPKCTARLNNMLEIVPDLRIVVSSTWRINQSLEQLHTIFRRGAFHTLPDLGTGIKDPGRVIGSTPVMHIHRGEEISVWLEHHPEVEYYVVFDDDTDIEPHEAHFVHCDGELGLGLEACRKALQILKCDDSDLLRLEAFDTVVSKAAYVENEFRRDLAEVIEQARARKGLTVRKLGILMGVSGAQLRRLRHQELGGSLSLNTLVRAMLVLDLEWSDFFPGAEDEDS